MISKITEIRKDLDPCKQYMGTPDYPNILVQAMGMLPSNINMENSLALIMQVGEVLKEEQKAQEIIARIEKNVSKMQDGKACLKTNMSRKRANL